MLERMIVGRIEHRLLIATVCFLTIILIIGWVAINEEARMEGFQQAVKGRSIEQGAMLYNNWCSICHGYDGLGGPHAPALNNPQLFGHDFFPEITQQIDDLTRERYELSREGNVLSDNANNPNTSDRDKIVAHVLVNAIDSRLNVIDQQIDELNQQRIKAVQPAVDKGYDPARPDRIKIVSWEGTAATFISGTTSQGRPTSSSYWPWPMPAFGEANFPVLRADEIEDITAYILNWDKGKNWTLDDLFAVQQFAIEPRDPRPLIAQINLLQQAVVYPPEIGSDVAAILEKLPDYTGDATRGDALFHGKVNTKLGFTLVCSTCHQQTADSVGPMANGLFTRVTTIRLKDPKLAGYTPEQYLVESIVQPGNYIVPNFNDLMLRVFGTQLSYQDLADVVAYIKTLQ
jgi:mono/diheme cytochrome c family protein